MLPAAWTTGEGPGVHTHGFRPRFDSAVARVFRHVVVDYRKNVYSRCTVQRCVSKEEVFFKFFGSSFVAYRMFRRHCSSETNRNSVVYIAYTRGKWSEAQVNSFKYFNSAFCFCNFAHYCFFAILRVAPLLKRTPLCALLLMKKITLLKQFCMCSDGVRAIGGLLATVVWI